MTASIFRSWNLKPFKYWKWCTYWSVLNNSSVFAFGTFAWTCSLRPRFLLTFCPDNYSTGFYPLDELLPGFLLNKWAPWMIIQHLAFTYYLPGWFAPTQWGSRRQVWQLSYHQYLWECTPPMNFSHEFLIHTSSSLFIQDHLGQLQPFEPKDNKMKSVGFWSTRNATHLRCQF